jgi:hypothetical protein
LKISLEARPKGTGVKWEFQTGGGALERAKPDDDTEWVWSAPDPPVATAIRFYLADYPDVAQVLEIQAPEDEPKALGGGPSPEPGPDLGDEGDAEPLPTDESPEASAEAGLTEAGVQPDEDVPFEDGEDESGSGEGAPGGVGS